MEKTDCPFTFHVTVSLIDGVRGIFDIKNITYANLRKNVLANLNQNVFIKKNLIDLANKGLFI